LWGTQNPVGLCIKVNIAHKYDFVKLI
jgi:hypothetical protein